MDWNAARHFLAVCDAGTLAGAAQLAGVSHATMFRHMQALEAELGTRLFDRIKGRYVLTDAGREMQEVARSIADAFAEIDRRVAGRDSGATGTVRLTAPRSFAETVLPPLLACFTAEHPGIHIEMLVSNFTANMQNREADIALRVAHDPPETLWGRKVRQIPWAFYAAAAYLEKHGRPRTEEDITHHRLIAPAGQLARHPIIAPFITAKQSIAPIRCDDLSNIAKLAVAGYGLALLPEDLANSELEQLFTPQIAPPNSLWVLTHPDLRSVPRIALLMGFLAKALAD